MHRSALVLLSFIFLLGSCVPKKKLATAEAELSSQRELAQAYRLQIDSLSKRNAALYDSLRYSDSLLAYYKDKADRKSSGTASNGAPKKSALSKDDEYEKKAVFIYNFTRQVVWPDNYNTDKFVIGVLGSSLVYDKLKKISKDKKVLGRPVEIRTYTIDNLQAANILFITHEQVASLAKVKAALGSKPMLLITEESFWSMPGSHVNFYVDDVRLRYQLNKAAAEKTGLKITQDMVRFSE